MIIAGVGTKRMKSEVYRTRGFHSRVKPILILQTLYTVKCYRCNKRFLFFWYCSTNNALLITAYEPNDPIRVGNTSNSASANLVNILIALINLIYIVQKTQMFSITVFTFITYVLVSMHLLYPHCKCVYITTTPVC